MKKKQLRQETNSLASVPLTAVTVPFSGAARGGERGEISPLSDPWGPFWIPTIKYCNVSLSKFNENK